MTSPLHNIHIYFTFVIWIEMISIEILYYACVHSEAEDDAGVPILPTTVNPDNWDPSKQRVVEYPQVIIVVPLIHSSLRTHQQRLDTYKM